MIAAGLLLVVWGIAVAALARPLHTHWRDMLERLRRAGVGNTIPGTKFFASPEGLRTMRRVGVGAVVVGAALLAAGLLAALAAASGGGAR